MICDLCREDQGIEAERGVKWVVRGITSRWWLLRHDGNPRGDVIRRSGDRHWSQESGYGKSIHATAWGAASALLRALGLRDSP